MSSSIRLDTFKGDGTPAGHTCMVYKFLSIGEISSSASFKSYWRFYVLLIYLEGHVWYRSLSAEQKSNPATIINLFQERFKDYIFFFGFVSIKNKQKKTQWDTFFTRVVKVASIKNISKKSFIFGCNKLFKIWYKNSYCNAKPQTNGMIKANRNLGGHISTKSNNNVGNVWIFFIRD